MMMPVLLFEYVNLSTFHCQLCFFNIIPKAAFHDCGTWDESQGSHGGCDGSLILAQEFNRPENNGLQDISGKLLALQQKWTTPASPISVADVIQVAGSVAIVTCPGGPQVTTFVGRKDNSTGAPDGLLPNCADTAANLFQLFVNKGFSSEDLAALLGAHTASKSFFEAGIPSGSPQDSTPGVWDVKYYGETLAQPGTESQGVFSFGGDINLANSPQVGKDFQGFVNNQGKWNGKFADAMARLSLLGVPGGSSNLIDCTKVIPKSTNIKREMKSAPINDRIR
jgi:hypothetical protein